MSEVIWSYSIDEILDCGQSLEYLGIKNWALSRQKAFQALNHLEKLQIPILGGDVYKLVNGVLQFNYDNWYCDKLPDESSLDFVTRSIDKARKYIKSYNIGEDDDIFFAIVPEI